MYSMSMFVDIRWFCMLFYFTSLTDRAPSASVLAEPEPWNPWLHFTRYLLSSIFILALLKLAIINLLHIFRRIIVLHRGSDNIIVLHRGSDNINNNVPHIYTTCLGEKVNNFGGDSTVVKKKIIFFF